MTESCGHLMMLAQEKGQKGEVRNDKFVELLCHQPKLTPVLSAIILDSKANVQSHLYTNEITSI